MTQNPSCNPIFNQFAGQPDLKLVQTPVGPGIRFSSDPGVFSRLHTHSFLHDIGLWVRMVEHGCLFRSKSKAWQKFVLPPTSPMFFLQVPCSMIDLLLMSFVFLPPPLVVIHIHHDENNQWYHISPLGEFFTLGAHVQPWALCHHCVLVPCGYPIKNNTWNPDDLSDVFKKSNVKPGDQAITTTSPKTGPGKLTQYCAYPTLTVSRT